VNVHVARIPDVLEPRLNKPYWIAVPAGHEFANRMFHSDTPAGNENKPILGRTGSVIRPNQPFRINGDPNVIGV
jgi:hypothetical protein